MGDVHLFACGGPDSCGHMQGDWIRGWTCPMYWKDNWEQSFYSIPCDSAQNSGDFAVTPIAT